MDSPASDARSDRELVAAINRGEEAAFDALYFRYRDWVVRLAGRFTGNPDDALDVLQETFGYLARKFPGFVLTATMTTFLYPVVKNTSIAVRRKRRREMPAAEELIDAQPAREEGQEGGEGTRAELARVLGGVPEAHREVLLMRFVDDMSLEEIAGALRVPLGTIKSRLHNAIAMLREDPRMRRYFAP